MVQVDHASDHDLLIRLTENLRSVQAELTEMKAQQEARYVTKDEFEPIQRLVYLLMGLLMTGLVGAALSVILRKP